MARKVTLGAASCALDLGDGSERSLYVDQDYILQKMRKTHRGISLMYTYYPCDKGWPLRSSIAFPQETPSGAWNYPYEDYFPYLGGKNGDRNAEPFNFMKEVRTHGQDVVLTLTIDPSLSDEYLISVAEDLRPYGRVLLRINHECTGDWFCFTKRASYQQIADFYVRCCNIFHKHSPNVKLILCAGMYQKETGKLEMEDIFMEAFKATDYWSCDQYLALHWGWPVDVAVKGGANFACYDADEVYDRAKKTFMRLKEITGMEKPFVMSELNADADVTGPWEQAEIMKHFMERLSEDKEHWLDAFTLYQFRDDGRLGCETTDLNNKNIGIEQPLLSVYRKQLHRDFFSAKLTAGEEVKFPCTLSWASSEDAEGVQVDVKVEKNPHYAELTFDEETAKLNLIVNFAGYTFYKAPGVKFVDLMSYFYDNPLKPGESRNLTLNYFAPPADGLNHPESGDAFEAADGEWMYRQYTVMPALPELRIEYEPVQLIKNW